MCAVTGDKTPAPYAGSGSSIEDKWGTGLNGIYDAAAAIRSAKDTRMLKAIKLLHSAVWLFMVSCILLIPWAALERRFHLAALLVAVILIECAVLAVNRGKCPLTSIAAQYTEDRADNFDIFLPLWLARHNKRIFGVLFLCGTTFALVRWLAAN